MIAFTFNLLLYLLSIQLMLLGNWNYGYLSRREPERPLTSEMLNKNCSASLNRPKNGSMNYNRSFKSNFKFLRQGIDLFLSKIFSILLYIIFLFLIFSLHSCLARFILKIESLRKIKVKLDSSQLMKSPKAILNFNINFWAIECTISSI